MTEPNGMEARLTSEWRELLASVAPGRSPLELPPERRMALGRIALFAQLEEVREEWRALRLDVDEEIASRFANASWTLQDLFAHLASWAREFRFEFESVLEEKPFDYVIPFAFSVMGPTQWNEREVQARKGKSLPEILDELEGETRALQDLLARVEDARLFAPAELPLAPSGNPSERWRGPLGFVVAGKCIHDRHHIAQIRDRLKRLRK